jgi:hypothetical protein
MLIFITTILFFYPVAVFGASFRDVPASHFARDAIEWVANPANGSIMVVDASNNFNPNRSMDKFEAARIFAIAAGYKYASASISPAEQQLFDRSFNEWRHVPEGMAGRYSRWSRTADREIAYLLHKNILTASDVGQFVTRTNNTETVNRLTKEEAIAWMVRLDGRQSRAEAVLLPYHTPYRDDGQIRADLKKYVYYAREIGLAVGSDGFINPTRPVTRAELALLFYNLLGLRPSATQETNTDTINTTVTGTIDFIFQNNRIYINTGGQPHVYSWAANAVVTVDGTQKSIASLNRGMQATAMVNTSGEIVNLNASTSVVEAVQETAATPVITFEDEGYVSAVTAGTVTLRIQRVRISGEIININRTFTMSSGSNILRGDTPVPFSDIRVNDIALFSYSGTEIHEMKLTERNRTIHGTLLEKKIVGVNTVVLVIEDESQKYELRVTPGTYFERNNQRGIAWDGLRVGDTVVAECEYDRLRAVYATGSRSTAVGTVEEITITQNRRQILLRSANGTVVAYTFATGDESMYSLRIGMEIRLHLDSREIMSIDILN